MFWKKSNKRSEQIEKLEAKLREEVYYKEFYRNRLDVEEHVKETLMDKLDKVTLMAYDRMEEIERLNKHIKEAEHTISTYDAMIDELLAKVERLKRSAGEDY